MKILQVSPYKYPAKGSAGAERYVERLCRGLVKLGHEVFLLCKEGSALNFERSEYCSFFSKRY